MADKRISQLVDRGTVANNDVVPIVVSGATTTNKATISSIQTFMQGNLDVGVTSVGITLGSTGTDVSVSGSPVTSSGNITINIPTASATNRGLLSSADWTTFNNKVSSVGLSMPSAFAVANSPITGSGTIAVTGAGTVAQYIRGDGSLADFPSGGGGGGASVNYYLNGSVSQGTIGGVAYLEMNKVPILGAGTDITIAADGYIASFITDAGDPALLEIPAGNWNFESYFSASSGGGSPSFYIELYKVNSGGTATLIASNSATPELISFGTSISPYFSPLAVPTTVLTVTDRLAVRYYVTHSGRTITLHTENSHLCQIITTFTTGLTALNGLTAQVQNFATGTSGTDFGISSSVSTHTFNIPTASAVNRGALSSADWTTFNGKQTALNGTGFVKISGTTISYDNSTYLTTASAASTYVPYTGAGANVDLGIYNLTANEVNVNGSGSSAGVINLESNTIFSLVNGYGTIGSGTSNQFNFYQTTGAGVFRGAILSLNSITASATRTFTLPDADGTLALTSDIPANPVGGTGTANIIPKFTGGSTLGDSSLQNVSNSISNLNPPSGQFAWQLNGNATTSQSFGALVVAGTNASDIAFAVRNTGGVTTLFEVQGDGNVGIGTNTPSNILEISTTSKGVSDRTGVNLTTSNSSAIDLGLPLVWSSNGTISNYATASIVGRRESATAGNYSGYLQFATTDSSGSLAERLRIASTGAATFSTSAAVGGLNLSATYASKLGLYNPSGSANMELGNAINTNGSIVSRLVSTNVNNGNTGNESSTNFIGVASIETQLVSTSGNASGTSGANILFLTKADGGTLTERMRITSDAYLRMASGTAGIQFNGDTAEANALDDYEEGTFTPTLGGTSTYTTQFGNYTKIGNKVFFKIFLTVNLIGTGDAQNIYGLPFTCDSTTTGYSIYVGAFQDLSSAKVFMAGRVGASGTTIAIRSMAAAAVGVAAANVFQNGSTIEIGGFYGV